MSQFYSQSEPFQGGNQQQQQQQQQSSMYGGGAYGQPQQQQSNGFGSYGAGGYSVAMGGASQSQQSSQAQQQQSSWQTQSQQPQHGTFVGGGKGNPPAQHQHDHQQHHQTVFNPAAAATSVMAAAVSGNNDAVVNAATLAGQQFLKEGTARLIPGLDLFMRSMRTYFAVDNRYVKAKLIRILFPVLKKNWTRQQCDSSAGLSTVAYATPIQDDNAFDLYIPLMALITYVLLCGLLYGGAGEFNPEVLPDVTTKCFITQVLEVLAIRFGFYTMQAPVFFLDLFSATGYKYVGLCVNMLVGLVLHQLGYGSTAYWATFMWTSLSACYLMLKSMANNIPRVTNAAGPKREFMVMGFAASQLATMWFMSQTKFL